MLCRTANFTNVPMRLSNQPIKNQSINHVSSPVTPAAAAASASAAARPRKSLVQGDTQSLRATAGGWAVLHSQVYTGWDVRARDCTRSGRPKLGSCQVKRQRETTLAASKRSCWRSSTQHSLPNMRRKRVLRPALPILPMAGAMEQAAPVRLVTMEAPRFRYRSFRLRLHPCCIVRSRPTWGVQPFQSNKGCQAPNR